VIQPFIVGHWIEVIPHAHVTLQSNLCDVPKFPILSVPDEQLAVYLFQNLAIFSLPHTANDYHIDECLLLLCIIT
jgi:hypothetical protein